MAHPSIQKTGCWVSMSRFEFEVEQQLDFKRFRSSCWWSFALNCSLFLCFQHRSLTDLPLGGKTALLPPLATTIPPSIDFCSEWLASNEVAAHILFSPTFLLRFSDEGDEHCSFYSEPLFTQYDWNDICFIMKFFRISVRKMSEETLTGMRKTLSKWYKMCFFMQYTTNFTTDKRHVTTIYPKLPFLSESPSRWESCLNSAGTLSIFCPSSHFSIAKNWRFLQ